jgi:hypothetical protein
MAVSLLLRVLVVGCEGGEVSVGDAACADDSDGWWRGRLSRGRECLLCAVELQQALLETGLFCRKGFGVGFEVSLELFLRGRSGGWQLCSFDGVEDVAKTFDQFVQTEIICPVAEIGIWGQCVLPFVAFVSHHELFQIWKVGFEAARPICGGQIRHPEASILCFDVQVQESDRSDWRRHCTDEHIGVARMRER